ncbi:MAG: 50S ribosomal protein L29 [Myxococcales bacterium]|jgi:ribosomal protein L29|nr:50S ribosomal protein L29 [Myxococcales bacterium]
MATAKEMRSLSVDELTRLAGETREVIFRQKIKHSTGTLEATSELLKRRRELARILTVLAEKASGAVAG